jgi:cytosine deaminase
VTDRPALLLRHARLADGRTVDVRCAGGVIVAVAASVAAEAGDDVVDLDGYVLLEAPVEPHAHLDKALTADRVPNPTGDLPGAVMAWHAYRPSLTVEDIAERAERAARILLANGVTAIRTHVDVSVDVGTRSVEALARVRRNLDGLVDLQVVALVSTPTTGLAGADNRAALLDALDAGADVVGGCPHLDPDPAGCLEVCASIAADRGLPIDLHTDEHLDGTRLDVRDLAAWRRASGFDRPTAASHCVSLGMQDAGMQQKVAGELAEAGVAVVTLPQTNLFLQGREHSTATPRGLTAVRALLDGGATLAAGADNLQDPFNTMGRGDPFETTSLLVMAGHLLPEEAWRAVTVGGRAALGLPSVAIEPGSPAELVAVPAGSLREAMAFAPGGRIVIHDGAVVAGRP